MAKAGQMDAVKIMAKDLVRTRKYVKKFMLMRANIQAVSLKIQTLKSQNSMAQAMKGVTKAMMSMNKQMKLPEIQKIMQEFEKQSEIMEKEQGNAESFMQPNYGGDFNLLDPSSLALPKTSSSEFDIANGKENHEFQALTEDRHLFKAYQAFTAPEVISAAADVYLKNFTSTLT